jgi:hypothetical protein
MFSGTEIVRRAVGGSNAHSDALATAIVIGVIDRVVVPGAVLASQLVAGCPTEGGVTQAVQHIRQPIEAIVGIRDGRRIDRSAGIIHVGQVAQGIVASFRGMIVSMWTNLRFAIDPPTFDTHSIYVRWWFDGLLAPAQRAERVRFASFCSKLGNG